MAESRWSLSSSVAATTLGFSPRVSSRQTRSRSRPPDVRPWRNPRRRARARISRRDLLYRRQRAEDCAFLAHAGGRHLDQRALGRHQGCRMAAFVHSDRTLEPGARAVVPAQCRKESRQAHEKKQRRKRLLGRSYTPPTSRRCRTICTRMRAARRSLRKRRCSPMESTSSLSRAGK